MNNSAAARLKNVLKIDKRQDPSLIIDLLSSDVKKLLENYFDFCDKGYVNTDVLVLEDSVNITINASAKRVKTFKCLPD